MAHLKLIVVPFLNAGQPLTIINMGFIDSLTNYSYDLTSYYINKGFRVGP